MKLHYIVTEGAYLDFNVYHFERSESVRKLIWRYRILIPAVWSLLAVGFSVARYYVSGRVLITYPAFFIALAALWYFLYPFFYWRSFKKRALPGFPWVADLLMSFPEGTNEGYGPIFSDSRADRALVC